MAKDPKQLAVEHIAASGLTAEDAKELGFEILSAEQVKALFPKHNTCNAPGLKLTYYDLSGKKALPTYRVRLLGELKGQFGEAVKLRYLQPAGTPPAPYFPRSIDWEAVADDINVPIMFTEGEKKAACAAKYGHACIGLGGVSSFRSAKLGVDFLPELEVVEWVNREVPICYDSDAKTNPDIMAATATLMRALISRGARPKVIEMPEVDGLKKTGLDDLIVARGNDVLQAAINAAPADILARRLWEFNERFIFVEDPGAIYDTRDSCARLIDAGRFKTATMANHWAMQQVSGSDGTMKLKKTRVAPEWVDWPMRAQVQGLTYDPGKSRFVGPRFNIWQGWGVEPKAGDVKLWKMLLAGLFGGCPDEEMRWFENWCLYPLTHAGAKIHLASAMWSRKQGLGKSLVGKLLGRVYGDANYSEVSQRDLERDFNGWHANKQFVMFDEVTAYDSRSKADNLKQLISEDKIQVNIKCVPTYQLPDCANFYLTSNKSNAFYLEEEDRRFFVHEVTSPKLDREFFREFYKWMGGTRESRELGAGPAALLHYAMEKHKYRDFDPNAPALRTKAKDDMIDAAKGEAEMWVAELARTPDDRLKFGEFTYQRDLFTARELLALFDIDRKGSPITTNVFALKLRENFPLLNHGEPIAPNGVSERFYAVRNLERWDAATTIEMIKHVRDARVGEQGKKGKF